MFSSKLLTVISTTILTTALSAPIEQVSSNFASNVVMTAGAAQFAAWIPTDGFPHNFSNLTCLNIGASATGYCNVVSVDQIAVTDGYSCAFNGWAGWSNGQIGTKGSGWLQVSPPQTLRNAVCVIN